MITTTGAAQRATRVDLLAEAEELDFKMLELVQHFKEVSDRAGDAIACPDQDHFEAAPAGIPHHFIQTRTACLHAADPVDVLLGDFVTALGGHLAKVVHLCLRVLVDGAHPEVERGAFHRRRPPYLST